MPVGIERDCTIERICFRRGLWDARITRFPRNEFRTGMSRGNRGRGPGFPGGGPVLVGRSPCSTAVLSYEGGASPEAIGVFVLSAILNGKNNIEDQIRTVYEKRLVTK